MRNLKYTLFSFFAMLILSVAASGATFTSIQSGDWSDPDTWNTFGVVPDPAVDEVIIMHTVYLDVNLTFSGTASLTITSDGSLLDPMPFNRNLTIGVGVTLDNSGEIYVNNIFNDGLINNFGTITTDSNFHNAGIVDNDGLITIHNFLAQNGTLTGSGGSYVVTGNINTNNGTLITCSGDPIDICSADGVTDPINGQGQVDAGCVSICGLALPLELLSFEVQPENEEIVISWATANEENVSHFEVLCSRDARQWENIGVIGSKTLAASERNTQGYRWIDPNPWRGQSYYQLKAVDLDGNFDLSPMVALYWKPNWANALRVYPNPVIDRFQIRSDFGENDYLQIIDLQGRVVQTKYVAQVYDGVDVAALPEGMYIIRVFGDHEIYSTNFVKQ